MPDQRDKAAYEAMAASLNDEQRRFFTLGHDIGFKRGMLEAGEACTDLAGQMTDMKLAEGAIRCVQTIHAIAKNKSIGGIGG